MIAGFSEVGLSSLGKHPKWLPRRKAEADARRATGCLFRSHLQIVFGGTRRADTFKPDLSCGNFRVARDPGSTGTEHISEMPTNRSSGLPLQIVGKQKNATNSVDHEFLPLRISAGFRTGRHSSNSKCDQSVALSLSRKTSSAGACSGS